MSQVERLMELADAFARAHCTAYVKATQGPRVLRGVRRDALREAIKDALNPAGDRATVGEPPNAGTTVEPVAWLHPDYLRGAYHESFSPVTTFYVRGWTPLYAAPPDDKAERKAK